MCIQIAKAEPFAGAPKIQMPSLYGMPTGKEILYRVPVTGERPIDIQITGLPEGLRFENGILTGSVAEDKEFKITVKAENKQGTCEKEVTCKVGPDVMLLTPLMGYTTWNAYRNRVTQQMVEDIAEKLAETGIRDYGYNYINVDSGWQDTYGGEFDAIMPNPKFPDMKGMCDKLHAQGYLCGIYSTPMLTAWGFPDADEPKSAGIEHLDYFPGCTTGEPDELCCDVMGGIGVEHKEENNVRQWDAWGFDYLKYDWRICDPPTAHIMKKALLASKRAWAYCVTLRANVIYGHYWSKYCTSWRDNVDTMDNWANVSARLDGADQWKPFVKPGHFYDLDMLEIGAMEWNGGEKSRLTDEEQLFAYTVHSFFPSPVQLSCRLEKLTEFEFNMICNDEMIRISQDALCDYPVLVKDYKEQKAKMYKRTLENGDTAIAVFNMSDEALNDHLLLLEDKRIMDVWTKEDLGVSCNLEFTVAPHCVRVFRISNQ